MPSLAEERSKLKERHRIAQNLHDSLGNSLTGINLQLEAALKLRELEPDTADALIDEAKQLAISSVQDLRSVVKELRVQDPLDKALKDLIKKVRGWNDLDITLILKSDYFVPVQVRNEVYQIVQEAVNNVIKHAQATQVQVLIETSSVLLLKINDDGQGFRATDETLGFGLKGYQGEM